MTRAQDIMYKLANAKKVEENLKKGLSPQEAWNRAYPDGTNPKDKGVTDPARPHEPKLAGWKDHVSSAVDAASKVPVLGSLVQGAQNAQKITQGTMPSALDMAGAIPGVGMAARAGAAVANRLQNANPSAGKKALEAAASVPSKGWGNVALDAAKKLGKSPALAAAAAVPGLGAGALGAYGVKKVLDTVKGNKALKGAARIAGQGAAALKKEGGAAGAATTAAKLGKGWGGARPKCGPPRRKPMPDKWKPAPGGPVAPGSKWKPMPGKPMPGKPGDWRKEGPREAIPYKKLLGKNATWSDLEKEAKWSHGIHGMGAKIKNAIMRKSEQAADFAKQNPVAAVGVGTALANPAFAIPAVGAAAGLTAIRKAMHDKQKAQGAAAAALGGAAGAAAVKTVDPAVGGELPKQ